MQSSEISRAMGCLEDEARELLSNPRLSPLERRLMFKRLLAKFGVLEDYKRALAAYIRRMGRRHPAKEPDPEVVLREILDSPEFVGLQLAILAALVEVTYHGGPRSHWVLTALVPVAALTSTRFGI